MVPNFQHYSNECPDLRHVLSIGIIIRQKGWSGLAPVQFLGEGRLSTFFRLERIFLFFLPHTPASSKALPTWAGQGKAREKRNAPDRWGGRLLRDDQI